MAVPDKKVLTKRSGESGTTFASGIIIGEEYNPKLQGKAAIRAYDEMRRGDATVNSALNVVKLPIAGADFKVDPASDDPADLEAAALVEDCLFHIIDWNQFLDEALTYLDFGFSLFEMVFEPRDINGQRRIALVGLEFRKQTTIEAWQTEGGGEGVQQAILGERYNIPAAKLVRFTHKQEGQNYEGRSVLRTAYKHWYIKDKLYRIDAVGHERQALGVIEVTVPKGSPDPEVKKMRKIVRNLRANQESFVEHPEGWTINFMDMKAKSLKDVEPSINHHDRQISKNVLAQFLEIGASGSSGTRSTSEDQSRLLDLARDNVAKKLVHVLQHTAVRTIIDLNYNDRPYPKLRVSKISDDNIPVISEAVERFVNAGLLHAQADDENTVRRMVGFQEIEAEELKRLYDELAKTKPAGVEATDNLKSLRASIEKALYERRQAA